MAQPAVVQTPRVGFEEFLRLTADHKAEWVYGEILWLDSGAGAPTASGGTLISREHDLLLGFVRGLLREYATEHLLGEVYGENMVFHLAGAEAGRCPDASFVLKERLSLVRTNYVEGAPDLAIEVISPESRRRDRADEFYEYEAAGVREYWILDPERQAAEFYRLSEHGRLEPQLPEGGVYTCKVLPGLWFRTEWLWREPLPRLREALRAWDVA